MHLPRRKLKSLRGVSLTHYALSVSVIVLACLTGVSGIGRSLSGQFQGLEQSMKHKISLAHMNKGNHIPENAFTGQDLNFETASGSDFQVQSYPQDLNRAIETLGANGATEIILANLDRLINQLKQQGTLNDEQVNQLMRLSNQGHKIAEIEALLESAHAHAKNRDDFINTNIFYHGKLYSVRALSAEIGLMRMDGNLQRGGEIKKFREILAQAASGGAMKDPVVNQVVTIMSEQIIALANCLESGVANITLNNAPLTDLINDYSLQRMNDESPVSGNLNQIAEISHGNSAAICGAGGAHDSGAHCASR